MGAQKSVNYVAASRINAMRSRNSCGKGGGDGVSFGIFPYIYKGSSGLTLSLT